MNKKYSREELKKVIDEIFEHYKKPQILEDEYLRYLVIYKKMTREEAEHLIFEAYRNDLIYIGVEKEYGEYVKVIYRPEDYELPPPSKMNKILKRYYKEGKG